MINKMRSVISYWLIRTGISALPPGTVKSELVAIVTGYSEEVLRIIKARREFMESEAAIIKRLEGSE